MQQICVASTAFLMSLDLLANDGEPKRCGEGSLKPPNNIAAHGGAPHQLPCACVLGVWDELLRRHKQDQNLRSRTLAWEF